MTTDKNIKFMDYSGGVGRTGTFFVMASVYLTIMFHVTRGMN